MANHQPDPSSTTAPATAIKAVPTNPAEFHSFFQSQSTALRSLIASLEDSTLPPAQRSVLIQQCLTEISTLSSAVKDAAVYLPPYDQRACATAIKGLTETLQAARETVAPRGKFKFKGGPRQAATPQTAHEADARVQEHLSPGPQLPLASSTPAAAAAEPPPRTIGQRISILPAGTPASTSHASMANCTNCVITLIPTASASTSLNDTPTTPALASLTLRNITSSIILLHATRIDGPTHMTNLQNCLLLLSTRQFRMHESSGCDVYLGVRSRPIVEGCSGIRFAPVPELDGASVGWGTTQNMWDQVDDFGWLVRGRQSPNWGILEETERLAGCVWRDVLDTCAAENADVLQVLKVAGVRPYEA